MKLAHLLLAGGLLSFSAAAAQTTPGTSRPSNPGPAGTASPSMPTSGMRPPAPDPKGAVSASEVFTKGDPNSTRMRSNTKRQKTKTTMDGSGKMKTKM